MGIFDWKHWLVLALVVLLFGGKRLKRLGADLGESIKAFRRSLAPESRASVGADAPARLAVESDAGQMVRGSGPQQ